MDIKKNFIIILMVMSLIMTISGVSAVIDWDNDADLFYYSLSSEQGTITSGGTYPAYDSLEDLTPNTNHGTAYNGIVITNDNSFDFDGSNDLLELNYIANLNSDLTFCSWIKTSGSTEQQVFMFRDYDDTGYYLGLKINTNGYAFLHNWAGSSSNVADNSDISDGNWHFVCGQRDSTNYKLYVDGGYIGSSSTLSITNTEKASYGTDYNGGSVYSAQFNGELAQPIIFNKALTTPEVLALYNEGRTYDPYATPANTPPTTPTSLSFESSRHVGETITATCSGSTDAEDSITYYYSFNGGSFAVTNTYTVVTSDAHGSVNVKCKAYDGTEYSAEYDGGSSTITNSLPTTPTGLVLLPPTIYTNDTLMAYASGSTDTDDDSIVYYYEFINQNTTIVLQAYSTSQSFELPTGYTFETILVKTKSYDGYGYSSGELPETTVIQNLKPSPPIISIDKDIVMGNLVHVTISNATDLEDDVLSYDYQIKIDDVTVVDFGDFTNFNTVGNAQVLNVAGKQVVKFYANISDDNIGKHINISAKTLDPYQSSNLANIQTIIGWTIKCVDEQNNPINTFTVNYNNVSHNTTTGVIILTDTVVSDINIFALGYYEQTISISSIDSFIIEMEEIKAPSSISPNQGVLNSYADISCGNDRNKIYQTQYNINGTWNDLIYNSGEYSFNLLNYDNETISFRCRTYDNGQYSAWITSSNMLIQNENKLNLRNINRNKQLLTNKRISFESYCSIDNDNEKIINTWSDCNNDGQYDYFNDLNNVSENSFLFVCKYDEIKDYEIKSGCIIQRLNESIAWDTCSISDKETYCNLEKSLKIEVEQ